MAEFSEIVYRGSGLHQRKGGGFSTLGVKSEEELAQALADGWYRTLPEAIDAHDGKGKSYPAAPAPAPAPAAAGPPADPAPDPEPVAPKADSAPPTRAELEQKAADLGLKFTARMSDKTLGGLIARALR